jgi:hypothetical protein
MMSVAKPTGEYADAMLDPGGWVETDEQGMRPSPIHWANELRRLGRAELLHKAR